jgi:hypothetical protein
VTVAAERVALVLAGLAFANGCSAWIVNGAEADASLPRTYLAHFKGGPCQIRATGAPVGATKEDYYLAQDKEGFVLFEAGSNHASALRNGWADDEGRHFFAWITTGQAWLYSLPKDARAPAERLVFLAGTYSIADDGSGRYRPLGEPTVRCSLLRQ